MDELRYKDPDLREDSSHTVQTSVSNAIPSYTGNTLLTIETMRYIPHERGTTWKIGMGLFTLMLLLIAVFTQAWFMAVAIVVFVWVYMGIHNSTEFDPLHANLIFTEVGIFYQGELYPYVEIETFFFVLDPDVTSFQFRLRGGAKMKVVVYVLHGEDIPAIKKVLKDKVTEQDTPEGDAIHRLFRILKL